MTRNRTSDDYEAEIRRPKRPETEGLGLFATETGPYFEQEKPPVEFDGSSYEPEADEGRLLGQLALVRHLMADGQWRSLHEICVAIRQPDAMAGVSARLRDLRKERFGGHTVERRRRDRGVFEYRLLVK